jgi:hypothetical protein
MKDEMVADGTSSAVSMFELLVDKHYMYLCIERLIMKVSCMICTG